MPTSEAQKLAAKRYREKNRKKYNASQKKYNASWYDRNRLLHCENVKRSYHQKKIKNADNIYAIKI